MQNRLILNVVSMRVHFHANKRNLSRTVIYYRRYNMTGNEMFSSCIEGELTYIAQPNYFFPTWQTIDYVERLICGNSDPLNLRLLNVNAISLTRATRPWKTLRFDILWEKEENKWMKDGEDVREEAAPRCYKTKPARLRGVRQPNSERRERQFKRGRNVTGRLGKARWPRPHTLPAGSRCLTLPLLPRSHALKETRSVPFGGSHIRARRKTTRPSSQNRASVPSGVCLGAASWGLTREKGARTDV